MNAFSTSEQLDRAEPTGAVIRAMAHTLNDWNMLRAPFHVQARILGQRGFSADQINRHIADAWTLAASLSRGEHIGVIMGRAD